MATVTRLTPDDIASLTQAASTIDGVISILECLMSKVSRDNQEVTVSELGVLHDSLENAQGLVISVFKKDHKPALEEAK